VAFGTWVPSANELKRWTMCSEIHWFDIMMQSKYVLMHEDDDFDRRFAFAKGEKDFP